jgi:hypothetical protein
MKSLPIFFLTLFFAVNITHARLGETPEQCKARYGEPTSVMAGGFGVHSVCVYEKGDFQITIFFAGTTPYNVQAKMVFYDIEKNQLGTTSLRYKTLKPEEESQILSAIPGRWEKDDSTATLNMSKGPTRTLQPTSTLYKQRFDACQQAVKLGITAALKITNQPYVNNLSHNNKEKFAFQVPGGMAIISYDAAAGIQKWAEVQMKKAADESKPPARSLDGF